MQRTRVFQAFSPPRTYPILVDHIDDANEFSLVFATGASGYAACLDELLKSLQKREESFWLAAVIKNTRQLRVCHVATAYLSLILPLLGFFGDKLTLHRAITHNCPQVWALFGPLNLGKLAKIAEKRRRQIFHVPFRLTRERKEKETAGGCQN